MTESDPRATFQLDQEAARTEQETREAEAHALQVRGAEAHAMQGESLAARLTMQAYAYKAAADATRILAIVVALHGLKRLVTRR